MTATTLPNAGMKYKWTLGEDGWNTGMDSNLLALDTLVQCSVISAAATTPPGSPTLGDSYIPATGATGAWVSLVGDIVIYNGSTWFSVVPKEGWVVYDNNTNKHLTYNGATWSGYTSENVANKSTSTSLGTSDTLYPSQKAVKSYVDTAIAAADPSGNTAAVVERSQKFGQFTRWTHTSPNGVYSFQGSSGGGYVVLTTTKLATISGGAAISDALYWNITSASSGSVFALSTAVWSQTGGNVVSTRWQTGDKMQAIFSLTLTDLAPSPTDDFVFRVGFANAPGQKITEADVFSSITSGAHDGSAAYFYADKDSAYWKCESGHLTTTETSVTTVAVAIDVLHVFHVVIATNGAVSFYIDGGLVATHTTGVIASGKCLNESMGFRNRATTATSNKGCILDQIAFRHELANQRTGFAFV